LLCSEEITQLHPDGTAMRIAIDKTSQRSWYERRLALACAHLAQILTHRSGQKIFYRNVSGKKMKRKEFGSQKKKRVSK